MKVSRESLEVSRESLEVSRESLEVSRESLEVSRESLEVGIELVELGRESVEGIRHFLLGGSYFFFWGGGYFFGVGSDFVLLFRRAENEISALFPGKRAETGRKINPRPFSRKKGGFFIFRLGGGRRAEGGFYRRPKYAHSWSLRLYHKIWDISEMFNAINEVAEYNIQSALKKQCLNSRCKFNQTP